ncbi:MAG: BTAD domain-containing putative transcriptional regulator, partial [Pseudonocardiaceae bacterium]
MFRVLGVVSVTGLNGVASFSSSRERAIFSVLAINANRMVSIEKIIDVVWEEDPPITARDQVYICVSNIRRTLKGIGINGRVQTRTPGYMLAAHHDEVDLHVFENRLANALAELRKDPASADAVARLRAVVTSWAGRSFVDVSSRSIRSVADQVAQRRLAALEECIAADIALGRHHEVLDELTALAAEHPLRSRLQVLYLTTLYHLGRRTDALLAYQHTRRETLDSLGVEPDAMLRRVHSAILAEKLPTVSPNGAHPVASDRAPCVRLLPPDIADFTDREVETEILRDMVASQPAAPGTIRPVIVSGAGGVGKTSLVRHVAHQVVDIFPDGQLYAELP